MSDLYIENISRKIRDHITKEEYPIAGEYLMDLCHYGIEIGNDMLVFLSSELSDTYRNSLLRVKEFIDKIDVKFIEEIKSKTFKLIEYMSDVPSELNSEKSIEIIEMLKFIIYHGERIQYELTKRERARLMSKRRLRD